MSEYYEHKHGGLAEILETRQFPGTIGTDRAFWQGRYHDSGLGDVSAPNRKLALYAAKKAGISVAGRQYISQLARFPNDPMAWVEDRGDILKRARELNKEVAINGRVVQRANEVAPPPDIGLAQDIVDDEVNKIIAREPEKARKREQVEAEVRDKHTPSFKKGKL